VPSTTQPGPIYHLSLTVDGFHRSKGLRMFVDSVELMISSGKGGGTENSAITGKIYDGSNNTIIGENGGVR